MHNIINNDVVLLLILLHECYRSDSYDVIFLFFLIGSIWLWLIINLELGFSISRVNVSMIGRFIISRLGPRAGSGAVSKWVICACDSLVDFGTV